MDALSMEYGAMPSMVQRMVYIVNALIVSLLPIYLYRSTSGMDLKESGMYFVGVSVASIALLATGYHKVTFWAYDKLCMQRDGLLTKNKIVELQRKHEHLQGTKEEIKAVLMQSQKVYSSVEATTFSLAFNNVLFLLLVTFIGQFILARVPTPFNYCGTVIAASIMVNLSSQKMLMVAK